MLRAIRRLWSRAPLAADRRRACRYPIADSPVYLGWWAGEEFRTTTAMLIDLSVQGASVLAKDAPGVGPVWLCPCHSAPSDWAEGTAVAVEREGTPTPFRRRWSTVRLEFAAPCSYELFKSGTGTGYLTKKHTTTDGASWGGRC
ncbi:MAG: hypothetical protein P4L84_31160 [Isosphaeraceae bacterium]|nr:hypothetical protein [Isosphaeraceae bacterium]